MRLRSRHVDPNSCLMHRQRTVIRGGATVSHDDSIGVMTDADVLFDGRFIADVGRDPSVRQALADLSGAHRQHLLAPPPLVYFENSRVTCHFPLVVPMPL